MTFYGFTLGLKKMTCLSPNAINQENHENAPGLRGKKNE